MYLLLDLGIAFGDCNTAASTPSKSSVLNCAFLAGAPFFDSIIDFERSSAVEPTNSFWNDPGSLKWFSVGTLFGKRMKTNRETLEASGLSRQHPWRIPPSAELSSDV